MNNAMIQRIYSDIALRGRRNTPTYNEVKRDAADLASRIDPVLGLRF